MFGRGKGTTRKNSHAGSMIKFAFPSSKNLPKQEGNQNTRKTESRSNRGTGISLRKRRKKVARKNSSSSNADRGVQEGSSFLNLNPSLADYPTESIDNTPTLKKTQSSNVLRFLSKTKRRKPKKPLQEVIRKSGDFEFEIGTQNKDQSSGEPLDIEEVSLVPTTKPRKGQKSQRKTRLQEVDVEKQSTRKTSAGTAAESPQLYVPMPIKIMSLTPIIPDEIKKDKNNKVDEPRSTTISVYGEDGREEIEISIKPKPKPKITTRAPPPVFGRGSVGNAAPKPPSLFELDNLDY